MTNYVRNLLLLLVAFTTLTFVACSEDDDGPDGEISGTIVGTWTGASATVNSFTINGEDISVFLDEFKQFLIDFGGSTQAEADAAIAELEALLQEGYTEVFDGTMTFNEDGTYEFTDSTGPESGTWELSNDGRTLTFDPGTEDELAMSIVSLTDDRLEGAILFEESDDADLDGTDDTLSVSISIVFTR